MITDKTLLKISIICAIIGLTGLFFIEPNIDNELIEVEIISSHNNSKGSIIEFLVLSPNKGFYQGNISKGKYLITASRGGNNFYYVNNYIKLNETTRYD